MSANYTFLPWTRQGLANHITGTQGPGRPTIEVGVTLQTLSQAPGQDNISVNAEILYPGDISGISPEAIIRTVPANNASDFEPYLLASVEFYEEDFPWRYTPQRPGTGAAADQLAPWLFLLVLEEDEFTEKLQGSTQMVTVTDLSALPASTSEMWAWAHVQVNQGLGTTVSDTVDFLENDLPYSPDTAFSRLFSPRRLKASTRYHAFLVPSFKSGRKQGESDSNEFAWPDVDHPNDPLDFPVYYRWSFRTGLQEDFEYLASQLKPYTVSAPDPNALPDPNDPSSIVLEGVSVDISDIGYDLTKAGSQTINLPTVIEATNTNTLEVPFTEHFPDVPGAGSPQDSRDSVRDFLKEGLKNIRPTTIGNTTNGKPIVLPPAYGRYHKKAESTAFDTIQTNPDWFHHINLDLRYRAVTAIGTRVVQQRQEDLAQQAWEQLKDVLEANQNLKAMQAGLQATLSLREKHLPITQSAGGANIRAMAGSGQSMEDYGLHVTAPVLSRIKVDPFTNKTLYQQVRESDFPMAALSPAFRRINRPFGKYQVNQAGLPLAADDTTAGLPDNPTLVGNEKTNLEMRDSLLGLIAAGKIKAAAPKSAEIVAHLFDPVSATDILSKNPIALPNTEGYFPEGTDLALVQSALQDINQDAFAIKNPPQQPLDLGALKDRILEATDPEPVFLARANRAIRFEPHHPAGDVAEGNLADLPAMRMMAGNPLRRLNKVAPVMAYPVFKQPMYEALKAYNENLFIPGLSNMPQNIITLMQVNDKAIEAYMLGLNHEMATELLWREYPTDQRGSYFQQFWDKRDFLSTNGITEAQSKDIRPIDQWGNSQLGNNDNPLAIQSNGSGSDLILLIKGDLLRKFPNIVIYAQQAQADTTTTPSKPIYNPAGTMRFPIQRADLDADVTILRFQLDATTAKGDPSNLSASPGWYFLLAERPGEPRFGMDIAPEGVPLPMPNPPASWNDLSWGHLTVGAENINTNEITLATNSSNLDPVRSINNGAHLAYALFQQPAMVAIHASDMLPD